MKKGFILSLFVCVLLCGCVPIQEMSLKEVIDRGTNREVTVYNRFRNGYKYNIPKGLDVIDSTQYNEVIASSKYKYYLYVDAVSYYNKVIQKYEVNQISYESMSIDYEDKYGYLEINELDDGKYFIEIMYNYAKIEVIVENQDIQVVVANAMSILASIHFNDNILKTLLDEEVSQFREYDFNIFETTVSTESEYLQSIEESVYDEKEEDVHDSDLIN